MFNFGGGPSWFPSQHPTQGIVQVFPAFLLCRLLCLVEEFLLLLRCSTAGDRFHDESRFLFYEPDHARTQDLIDSIAALRTSRVSCDSRLTFHDQAASADASLSTERLQASFYDLISTFSSTAHIFALVLLTIYHASRFQFAPHQYDLTASKYHAGHTSIALSCPRGLRPLPCSLAVPSLE